MKRVIYFSVFMVIAMIMTTGCTKCDDDPTPTYPTEVTDVNNLNGSWEFVNLYVQGVGIENYKTKADLLGNPTMAPSANDPTKAVLLSLLNVVDSPDPLQRICTVTDVANGTLGTNWVIKRNYAITGRFNIYDAGLVQKFTLTVKSYDNTTGVLKLTIGDTTTPPVLTLQKI